MDLIFLDVETTGGNAQRERITEIGFVHVSNDEVVEEWSTLINPERPIPPFISEFTGITDAMVQDAPTFADIHRELFEKLEGKIFVAQNARFDYSFIKSEFRRVGVSFTAKVLCTAKLSRRLYPRERKHNLDIIMERHGLRCSARHRALGDARVLWDFWQAIHHKFPQEEITPHLHHILKKPSAPTHVPDHELETLPECPGVYLMYGKDDELLYVGKSVDIRSRVLSHFSADHRSHKEMRLSQLTHHIETIPTAGELGALLKEAQLIKNNPPILNRQLRKHRSLNSFKLQRNQDGYYRMSLVNEQEIHPKHFQDLFGIFRTKPSAKKALQNIAEELQLCQQLLGLEKGTGACFAYQLNKCHGACVGEEPLESFNNRLLQAIKKMHIGSWPYTGPIGIREQHPDNDRTEVHVINNWCHLGTCTEESEIYDLIQNPPEFHFDLDIYKILKRAFRKNMIKKHQIIPL